MVVKINSKFELGILVILCFGFFAGIIVLETTIAAFFTLYFGIEFGQIIAMGFAGLNLVGLSYIGLDFFITAIKPESTNQSLTSKEEK